VDGKNTARRATQIATAAVLLSALACVLSIADAELWRLVLSGGSWWERLAVLRAGSLGTALWAAMGSAIFLAVSGGAWYLLAAAADEDDLYWWRLEEAAKARAAARGAGADALTVARTALEIESETTGHRPETIRRWLDALVHTPSADEIAVLKGLHEYARTSQMVADRVVRQSSRPDLALVQFAGREYTALELTGHFARIRSTIAALLGAPEDIVDKTTATPAPGRRR
jgi:hypothetical protein